MPARQALPWCYGNTVGELYGQNKRFIAALAKGSKDPRWIGFMELALRDDDVPIPRELSLFIVKFRGTAEQRATLSLMLDEARDWWTTRMYEARL